LAEAPVEGQNRTSIQGVKTGRFHAPFCSQVHHNPPVDNSVNNLGSGGLKSAPGKTFIGIFTILRQKTLLKQ
jgi:hypothetical protein